MAKKDGVIREESIADAFALLYAVDQTHEIMKSLKEAK